MKFYRVHLYDLDGSHGFAWYTNKRDADATLRNFNGRGADCSVTKVEIKPTKACILAALHVYATHADNG